MLASLQRGAFTVPPPHTHLRYGEMPDCDLALRAQQGESSAAEYLLYKYRHLVRVRVKSFFLMGAEPEDLLQVGMIGLWLAIFDFQSARSSAFPAFAKVCITRHVITAVKTATRLKQMPLNTCVSLDAPSATSDAVLDWRSDRVLSSTHSCDPEYLMLRHEDTAHLHDHLRRELSAFEWHVLSGYQTGQSYREIACDLNCNTKSVDNALGRIKRKVSDVDVGEADIAAQL